MSFLNLDHLLGGSSYFYDYSRLTPYFSPPTNYIGSAIFLSYIAVALVLTTYITWELYTRYHSHIVTPQPAPEPSSNKDHAIPKSIIDIRTVRSRHIKIYALLSSISFAMLSYHILNFLIASFQTWSPQLRGIGSFELNTETLKQWMLNTSLFENFARELVGDGPSTVWMQLGVLGSWFWGVWIGGKAEERKFGIKKMVPYIALSQILPPSFTATHFLINLHLSSPDLLLPNTPVPANPTTPLLDDEVKPDQPPPSNPRPTTLLLPTILLNIALLSLAPLRTHFLFMPLVLFTRLLLLLPYTGRISTRKVEIERCMMVSCGFLVGNLMVLRKGYGIWDVLGALTRGGGYGGWAVRTFGWDSVLGVIIGRVVGWGGGV